MDELKLKSIILDTIEQSLAAQLRAVRRLRSGNGDTKPRRRKKSMSQVDMTYDILWRAKTPLHVSEIIARIEQLHGQQVDRESLVSALVKKVQRQDRFMRTDKNVFGLIEFGR
jgi:uncharacterized membrane protein YccC